MLDQVDAGWGNKILKIRGIVPIVVIILGVALYFSGTLLIKQADAPIRSIESHSSVTDQQHGALSGILAEQRAQSSREHHDLIKTQERIADSLDAQVFYLSKTERERANYKIEMPDSLRRKLIDRTDGNGHGPQ
jgi:hypothetical protein